MIKILIPNNNTNWSTSENLENSEQKNVISFPGKTNEESIAKRNEFINYYLLEDKIDFLNLENGYWVEKELIINDIFKSKIKLSINDYLLENDINKKRERMENLNNIIIYQNNLFKFYSISKIEILDNDNFTATINLDIYLTYPISTILNGETLIDRAHLRRNDVSKLQIREDFNIELSKVEEVDVQFKYANNYSNNSIIWIIGLKKLDENEKSVTKIGTLSLNFNFYLYPIIKFEDQNNTIEVKNSILINNIKVSDTLLDDTNSDEFISFYILESPLYPDAINIEKIDNDFVISLSSKNQNNFELNNGKLLIKFFDLNKEMGWSEGVGIHDFFEQSDSYLIAKQNKYEHKLYVYPFEYYKIETNNGINSIKYDPLQLLWNNQNHQDYLRFNFSLNPWTHSSSIYFENALNKFEVDATWNINQYCTISDNEYPKRTLSYGDILKDIKVEQYSEFLKNPPSNPKRERRYSRREERRKNKYINNLEKNSTSKINGDLFTSYLNGEKGFSWKLNKYSLNASEREYLFDYFYQYGYKLNQIENIQKYLNSRYWFNFLKIDKIFSLIDNNLAKKIKLKINDDFRNGITFWHYRTKKDWKGIKNYDLENLETEFIKINQLDEKMGTIKEFLSTYDPNKNDKYLGIWKKLHEYNPEFTEGMTTVQAIESLPNQIFNKEVLGHNHKLADRYVGSGNKSEGTNDNSTVLGYIDGYDSEGYIVRIGQSHNEKGILNPYSGKNSSQNYNLPAGIFTVKWVRVE
ncbi:/ / hypothetical protein / 596742:598991 Reverse [Candidatus Hepatoplasma crinochetorum]|uniref:Uncharacterized protein n=1 Tax=Candidatus Hepatoplasma crinochetorum TaxID=295596 RepID=A0A0G7ZLS1_9MOLU|nr:/ / hypothetical protein / 596742:598991 Reverse [Candidatus Hepatoplasma crinochetorum]